jgi:RNA recognition motif-containing protein
MSATNWADEDQSSDEGSVGPRHDRHESRVVQDNETQQYSPSTGHRKGDSYRRQRAPAEIPSGPPYVAFVGNLPFSMTDDDICNFFHGGGCDVKGAILKLDDSGRPKGSALVEFHDRKSLETALEANDHQIDGRSIRVDVDNRRPKSFGGGRTGGSRFEDRGHPSHDRGGRDRSNRYGDNRGDRPPRRDHPNHPKTRDSSMRSGDRDRDRGRDRGIDTAIEGTMAKVAIGEGDGQGALPPPPPATRPKINIQPRTLPVETIGKIAATNEKIFGGGKPHDEKLYEVCCTNYEGHSLYD